MNKNVAKRTPEDQLSGRWVKVTVTYSKLDHLASALPLAVKLSASGFGNMLYFARYTTSPYRVEMQLLTTKSYVAIFKAVMGFRYSGVKARGVRFEECNGSFPHALAYNLVRALQLSGRLALPMFRDIIHWMYNMAGFSYMQEAASALIESHAALRGIPGWSDDQPVFGPRTSEPKAKVDAPRAKKISATTNWRSRRKSPPTRKGQTSSATS